MIAIFLTYLVQYYNTINKIWYISEPDRKRGQSETLTTIIPYIGFVPYSDISHRYVLSVHKACKGKYIYTKRLKKKTDLFYIFSLISSNYNACSRQINKFATIDELFTFLVEFRFYIVLFLPNVSCFYPTMRSYHTERKTRTELLRPTQKTNINIDQ